MKIIFFFSLFCAVSIYSCSSSKNTFEVWYSEKDTVKGQFEIEVLDTTFFLSYNYVILKDKNYENYFILVDKKKYKPENFKSKYQTLQIKKLPCNMEVLPSRRNNVDLIFNRGITGILWIKNRITVDAFEIIE